MKDAAIFEHTFTGMKDIAFIFSIGLVLILGITSLDRALEKIAESAAYNGGQNLPGFLHSPTAALVHARTENLPAVLVFGRRGEGASERFKEEVLRSSNVNAVKNNFVWAYVDAGQDMNSETLKRYQIKRTPVICVVDGQGQELRRIEGGRPAHELVAELARVPKLPADDLVIPPSK